MKAMTAVLFGSLGFLLALPAAAFEVIRLNDGTVIRGEVISRNDSIVEVESENMGRVKIKKKNIVSSPVQDTELKSRERVAGIDPDPIGHTLLLMPTAFTPPKGSLVFRDFELLFLTLGYSPTNSTSVVAGAMLPFTSEFNALTMGVKQGLYQKANGAVAVVGNVTVPLSSGIDETGFIWLVNAVASYRFDDRLGVHVAAGGIGAQGGGERSAQGFSAGLGADLRVSNHVKLLTEVLYGGTTFDPGSSGTLVNFGIRLHGERISADIGGVRPIEDMGSLLFIPLISIGYRF
jgi:hypothetical protein